MVSTSESQIAPVADDEARRRGAHCQPYEEYSLGPEPTLYCPSIYGEIVCPSSTDGIYSGMPLSVFPFKTESDEFNWDPTFHRGFGMDT